MAQLASLFRSLFSNPVAFAIVVFVIVRVCLSPLVGERVCGDGWRSGSIGSQGACSWHGGVGGLDRGGWVTPLSVVLAVAAGLWRRKRVALPDRPASGTNPSNDTPQVEPPRYTQRDQLLPEIQRIWSSGDIPNQTAASETGKKKPAG